MRRLLDQEEWMHWPIAVAGGGDCFFRLQYDVASGKFSNLQINGGA